jgi:hypothetical protein
MVSYEKQEADMKPLALLNKFSTVASSSSRPPQICTPHVWVNQPENKN